MACRMSVRTNVSDVSWTGTEMNKLRLGAIVLAFLPTAGLLVGCDTSGSGGSPFNLSGLTGDDNVRYRCDGDRGFRVTYDQNGDRATVDTGDDSYRLGLEDRDG